jgi:hypothetical protein
LRLHLRYSSQPRSWPETAWADASSKNPNGNGHVYSSGAAARDFASDFS